MDSNQPQQHTPPNFHDFSTNLRGRKGQPPEAKPRTFQARGWPWPYQASAGPRQASARRTVNFEVAEKRIRQQLLRVANVSTGPAPKRGRKNVRFYQNLEQPGRFLSRI